MRNVFGCGECETRKKIKIIRAPIGLTGGEDDKIEAKEKLDAGNNDDHRFFPRRSLLLLYLKKMTAEQVIHVR